MVTQHFAGVLIGIDSENLVAESLSNFIFKQGVLRYLTKRDTAFPGFAVVCALFYKTLEYGWDDLCADFLAAF